MNTIDFRGGIVIPTTSDASKKPIAQAPLPKRVVLPLEHSVSQPAEPLVSVGERVLTGQKIACHSDAQCTSVHASLSGVISAIDEQPMIRPSNLKALSITIESDGKDEWIAHKQHDKNAFLKQTREQLIAQIKEAGIVGLGGAGFPTYLKIAKLENCQTLIINAMECEPNVSCDDVLMQAYPNEILDGIKILLHITEAKKALFAIEYDKKSSLKQFNELNQDSRIEFIAMPPKYTSGTERILMTRLLGLELSNTERATDRGVLCQNVATIKAIYDAIIEEKPLVSRIVSIVGDALDNHQNYDVRLGTPINALIEQVKPAQETLSIRANGMMMGIDVTDTNASVRKTTNALFINKVHPKPVVQSCIRCGQCNDVCPVNLLPQQLYWYAKSDDIDKALAYNLMDCIECNCCTYVCPSHIPLVSYYQRAKALHRKQTSEKHQADVARERFEFREYRLERNKKEKKAMMERKKKELQAKLAQDKAAQEKIAAALKEVKK